MSRRGQLWFFLPALLVYLVFVLIPCSQTLIDSFFAHPPSGRRFVGTLFYRYALVDPKFHQALGHNFAYLFWTLWFEVIAGLGLALGLEKPTRLNYFLRVAFFSPAVLSMVVIGLVFGFLCKDGLGVWPGLLDEKRALLTVSVISGWASCGFFMAIFLAGLAQVPVELLEAARLDGAGAWQTFWRIQWPLLQEVFAVALLICFTGAFKAFDLFWVLLPNQEQGRIVSTMLVNEVLKFDNRGYGSTLAVLLTLFVLAIAAGTMVARALARRAGTTARSPGR